MEVGDGRVTPLGFPGRFPTPRSPVVNEQILAPVALIDRQPEETEKTGYTAPQMFAVGQTVELIQGAQWRGPQDWPGSWYPYPL